MKLLATIRWLVIALGIAGVLAYGQAPSAPVIVAQISDTHLGEARAPHAAEHLRMAVQMINARHPDVVVLTGDIGEKPEDWEQAKTILKNLASPLYYVAGNHDVHTKDVSRYRSVFGQDYYQFRVKNVDFIVIDSQLLGNYEQYDAKSPPPLPPETEQESRKMLQWLQDQAARESGGTVIGLQHIPPVRDSNFPPDSKPYWVVNEPYRSREIDLLHELRIRHMLVGHWHNGRLFNWEGISWHVAPATSWLPWGGQLGFAIHAITLDGDVQTEFVNLPDAQP
jgi:3',5'-cyclic AMP phosphodiesterase CpdA